MPYIIQQPGTVFSTAPEKFVSALQSHIEDHDLHGHIWPDTAVYACVYRKKAWPCGWGNIHAAFFDTVDQMIDWIEKQETWSKQEDNDFLYDAYVWELGPVLLSKYDVIFSV